MFLRNVGKLSKVLHPSLNLGSPFRDTIQNFISKFPFYIHTNSIKLTNAFNAAKFLKI
jgi:hypothetical protein